MCGFWGALTKSYAGNFTEEARSASKSLLQRGADGTNTLVGANFHFVHSRLNLNGVSTGGEQPVDLKSKVMVYNGELYNKKYLAAVFSLDKNISDTQLLSILLATRTLSEITPYLNGMYAITLYDLAARRVEMAVDTYGQKPLFYRVTTEGIVLGSQAKIVAKKSGSSFREDQLAFYLNFGFSNPCSGFFDSVERVQPGELVTFELDNLTVTKNRFCSVIEKQQVNDCLLSSLISEYVDSPFPTGVTLSGGIDSSLMAHYYKLRYQGDAVAFTIDVEDAAFRETEAASFFAKKLGIRHRIISVASNEIEDLWSSAIKVLDEPNSDSSLITTSALMKGASSEVKCLISGDGGDEIFIGYNRHKLAYLKGRRYFEPFANYFAECVLRAPNFTKRLLSIVAPSTLGGEVDYRLNSLVRTLKANDLWTVYVMSLGIDDFFNALVIDFKEEVLKNFKGEFNSIVDLDRYFYLVGNNLTRMDKISLAYGIESRAPLLDDALQAQLVANVGLRSKPLLRELHRAVYGDTKIPKKGFSHPLGQLVHSKKCIEYANLGVDIVRSMFGSNLNIDLSACNDRRVFNLASMGLWCSNN